MRGRGLVAGLFLLPALTPAGESFIGGGVVERITAPELPGIAIIIDDLGNAPDLDRRAVELPAPVACAFLPHTRTTPRLARAAFAAGKEVLIHQPMESLEGRELGPGGLRTDMSRDDLREVVIGNLAAVPYATGMNNHMGSLLTANREKMDWLMEEISRWEHFFFVDSRTDDETIAEEMAWRHGVPGTRRDLFLDNEPTHEAVGAQFDSLIRLAKRNGSAIAIGHPYPATLDVLEQRLQELATQGVRLVPLTELIARREEARHPLTAAVGVTQGLCTERSEMCSPTSRATRTVR